MKLSVIIPCFNEEEVLLMTHERMKKVSKSLNAVVELLYINDGSKDNTGNILEKMSKDVNVRVLTFSRNFGHQAAVSAGLKYCSGDAAVIIDADLQDPPEIIPEMLQLWSEGYEVVYGQRRSRKGETIFKKITASMYYRMINRLSEVKLPLDTGDFRLVDRKVINAFNKLPESDKYIRGLFSWLGFKQKALPYDRDERAAGETKYPIRKMLKFASDGIMSFSKKPLEMVLSIGMTTLLISLGLTLYTFLSYFLKPDVVVPGWASTILIILFLGSVQLLSTGILGKYIGRIYSETKGRPEYIVSQDSGDELDK